MKLFRVIGFLLLITLFGSLEAKPLMLDTAVWEPDQFIDPFDFRKKLAKQGLYLLPAYILDLDWPTTGGFKTTHYPLYLFLFSLQLGIDFEQLCHIKGLLAYLDFQVHEGRHPTRDFVQDFQGFDNLEAFDFVQLAELWLQKSMFNRVLDLRIGKIDAFSLFCQTQYAQPLINNSYTQFPTLLGYPSYPNPAVGIALYINPCKWLTLKSALFDGSGAQGVNTGNLGARRFFKNMGKHLLLLNEVNFFWKPLTYSGEVITGLWAFNGRLTNFNGRSTGKAASPYLSVSQTIWQQNHLNVKNFKPATLGAFFQGSYANQQFSAAKFFVSGGLTFQNLVKKFNRDHLSLGASTVYFSSAEQAPFTQTYETSLECTYRVSVFQGFSIQPDIQWILQPGGVGRKNALVAVLRLTLSL